MLRQHTQPCDKTTTVFTNYYDSYNIHQNSTLMKPTWTFVANYGVLKALQFLLYPIPVIPSPN